MDFLLQLFSRLSHMHLTVNLVKSEFGHCQITFLGRVVGQGKISPIMAKVEAVSSFPEPRNNQVFGHGWVLQKVLPQFLCDCCSTK